MSNKIIFGSDLIDVLENKYNMNKLGEVPTKYKFLIYIRAIGTLTLYLFIT